MQKDWLEQLKQYQTEQFPIANIIDKILSNTQSQQKNQLRQNFEDLNVAIKENNSDNIYQNYEKIVIEIIDLLNEKEKKQFILEQSQSVSQDDFIAIAEQFIRNHQNEIITLINQSNESITINAEPAIINPAENTDTVNNEPIEITSKEKLTDEEILGSIFQDANVEELLEKYEKWQSGKEKINKLFVPPDNTEGNIIQKTKPAKRKNESESSTYEVMVKIMYAACTQNNLTIEKPFIGNNNYTAEGELRGKDDKKIFREESYEYFLLPDKGMVLYNIEAKHFLYYFPFAVNDPAYWCGLEKSKLNILAGHAYIHKLQKNPKDWEEWTNSFRKLVSTSDFLKDENDLREAINNGEIDFTIFPAEKIGEHRGCYVTTDEETGEEEIWATINKAYEIIEKKFQERQEEIKTQLESLNKNKKRGQEHIIDQEERILLKDFITHIKHGYNELKRIINLHNLEQRNLKKSKQVNTSYNVSNLERIIKEINIQYQSPSQVKQTKILPSCYTNCTIDSSGHLLIGNPRVNDGKNKGILESASFLMLDDNTTTITMIPNLEQIDNEITTEQITLKELREKKQKSKKKQVNDQPQKKKNIQYTYFFRYDEIIDKLVASNKALDEIKNPNKNLEKYIVIDKGRWIIDMKKMLYVINLKDNAIKIDLNFASDAISNLNSIASLMFYFDNKENLGQYINKINLARNTLINLVKEYLRLIQVFHNSDYSSLDDFDDANRLSQCRNNFKTNKRFLDQKTESGNSKMTDSDFYKLYLLKDKIQTIIDEIGKINSPVKSKTPNKIIENKDSIINSHKLDDDAFDNLIQNLKTN